MLRAFVDTLRSALRSLRANKLRSALTLLGIVIGVVAVVAMAATTEGLRRKISADLAQLGTGVFQVQKWPVMGGGPRNHRKFEKRKNFTLADVRLLEDKCVTCLRIAGEVWSHGGKVSAGERSTQPGVPITGGTAAFFDNNGFGLGAGRYFTEGETESGADVAVIGGDVAEALFPGEDPLGQRIRVRSQTYRVVGLLERRGSTFDGSYDNLVVIPLSTFLPLYGQRQSLNLTIQVRDPERMQRTQDEVVALLRRARGVPPEAENDFDVFSNQSMQETFENLSGMVATASIGICAIALLIGGIGVMNIMLVSVTERTSEIGLRRALGARRRRILGQFIAEAIALTTSGGVLGIILGAGVAKLVKVMVDIPTVVPAWAVLLSLASAGGVGLVFGIYPAMRAARLDPVEAMRRE